MLKKKPIYIILLVIFSLILCAEAVICLLPDASQGNIQRPEGFDPENMQMPENFGERPTMEVPAGIADARKDSSPLGTLKNLWLPIILVCLAGDIFCIVMLKNISRKNQTSVPAEAPEQKQPSKKEEIHKKNKRLRILALVTVVVFIAVVALLPVMFPRDTDLSSADITERLISAQAKTGSMDRALLSGGVLTDDDPIAVSIPADVEIEEYAVENGDPVKVGDLIATVEPSSVMIAIAEMQQGMDALDARLEDAADATMKTTVTMPSEGRIKKIFAAAEDDVVEVMYENGALMLVSLDGLMAVDIETDQLSIGDHVTVTFSDGTEQDGRVAALANGIATVTTSDETAAYDESVSVSAESGAALGSGKLYIHSELKITGYAGTVSSVYAKENAKLSAGKKLLSIEEENYTANYSALYRERIELEESLSKLLRIYQDGGIYAEYDGMITGISDGEEETEESTDGSQGYYPEAYYQSGWGMMNPMLASADSENKGENPEADKAKPEDGEKTDSGEAKPEGSEKPDSGETKPEDGEKPDSGEAKPENSEKPDIQLPSAPQYHGIYPAMITRVSYGSIRILISPAPQEQVDPANFTVDESQLTLPAELLPTNTTIVETYSDGAPIEKTLSDLQTGDLLLCEYDETGALVKVVYRHTEQQQQPNFQDFFPQDMLGNSSAMMDALTQEDVEEEYKLTKTAVCEIIPDDCMTVSLSVDELDILALSLGQQAIVKPDSMSGQSFTGEIIEIDRTGTNSGGNTKYSVQIKLPREEDMLSGMNASVVIGLGQQENVLTVPAEALHEDGTKTVIYTGYDKKEDLLTHPVEVTTGYSDGTSVEITSGLSAGDTYYYRYADTITYSFN